MAKFLELALDTADPRSTVAEFWAPVVGGRAVVNDPRFPADVLGETEQQGICVCPVPEPKTVKNRVHLDVNPSGVDQAEELERLLALGARKVDVGQGDVPWVVLADPEGNEFCLLGRRIDD
jgi:hypothetical protein